MKRMITLAVLLVCGAVWMAMMALDVVRLTDGHMNKGIRSITYNVLNLPSSISFSDGHIIRNHYAADGRKLQTQYLVSTVPVLFPQPPKGGEGDYSPFRGLGGLEGETIPLDTIIYISGEAVLMTRDYCGNVIYRDGALERVLNDYGYMDSTGNYHYYIKDYQDNVRAVIDHYGTLEEVNNYYPYGALMGGGTVGNNASVQPYKYGTKELDRQNGLDWYDADGERNKRTVPLSQNGLQ